MDVQLFKKCHLKALLGVLRAARGVAEAQRGVMSMLPPSGLALKDALAGLDGLSEKDLEELLQCEQCS